MKKLDEVDYIKKYNPSSLALKADLLSQDDLHLQNLIPELTSLSKEIRSYKRGFLTRWMNRFRKERGLIVLFTEINEPGKAFTCKFLNERTKAPIYRIDLAMVINKYIGETEKNLNQLFTKGEKKDWILFFDTADALFGKKTEISDAHDRFSNPQPNFLLEQLKNYKGVVILATNSKHQLDTAFSRRIHRVINFSLLKNEDEE